MPVLKMSYVNHEAVPEQVEVDNFFGEVTLFKRNPRLMNGPQRSFLRSLNQRHFLYYQNGKCAGRVTDKLFCNGVHGFQHKQRFFGALFGGMYGLSFRNHVSSDPCILHYPICSFQAFLEKYRTLGAFDNAWFGRFRFSVIFLFT